ncbi:MAG: twin-arginine translocase TatA/TatE family subunit [Candidatus Limnocylindrales bacterium]
MPDIGPMEVILVLAIALLVLGPSKLPEIGKSLGSSIREFRKATTDVQESVQLAPALRPSAPVPQPPAQSMPAQPMAPAQSAPVTAAPPQPAEQPVPVVQAQPPAPVEAVAAPAGAASSAVVPSAEASPPAGSVDPRAGA